MLSCLIEQTNICSDYLTCQKDILSVHAPNSVINRISSECLGRIVVVNYNRFQLQSEPTQE
jgi:hypothetical protein